MRVLINASNEVLNFLWGAGHDDRPLEANERKVVSYNFDTSIYKEGRYINDKELDGIKRYYIDDSGVVSRRSDAEIEAMPEHVEVRTESKFKDVRNLVLDRVVLQEVINQPSIPQSLKTRAQTKLTKTNQELAALLGL